ncbi:MAG: 3-oxoacyl-[acyl-carrier-protein] synthase III C-terminal domain-containing protein [Patescibacteria group bacterium]
MDVIGNVSAAATPYLLDTDLEQGKVELGSGKLAIFAALGAGVHAGGHLIRL